MDDRSRFNIHSHVHRWVAALIAVYPVTTGAIVAPWPAAVVIVVIGAFVV